MEYDVFISRAREDKDTAARPLTAKLRESGVKVRLDEFELKLGDSLRRSIERGLSQSKFGIIILSKNFFRKEWTQRELDVLLTKEETAHKVILPIWHEITKEEVIKFSPLLADKLAASTEKGIEYVAQQILSVIREEIPLDSAVVNISVSDETRIKPVTEFVSSERIGKSKLPSASYLIVPAIVIVISVFSFLVILLIPNSFNSGSDFNTTSNMSDFNQRLATPSMTNSTPTVNKEGDEVIEYPKEALLEDCRFFPDAPNETTFVLCSVFNGFRDKIITGVVIEVKLETPLGPQILRPTVKARLPALPFQSGHYITKLNYPIKRLSLDSRNIIVTLKPTEPVR